MTGGTSELPPGQTLKPGRHWWRRLVYLPLVLLTAGSLVALVVGFTANQRLQAAQELRDVPASADRSDAPADPVSMVCTPPVPPAAQEPWIDGDGTAESIWQEHAEELDEDYIVGPNGWIFWNDYVEQYASQAVGRANLTTGQVQRWIDYYSSIEEALATKDIEFYIVVTPSTSSIYPEELPEWMQPLRGSTMMDQFMSKAVDLPIIDLRQPLVDAKDDSEFHSFSWSNSHWTEYGGYLGWTQIAACVNAMHPDDAPLQVPAISSVKITGDFNEWASYGVDSPGVDWAVPVFTDPLAQVEVTGADGVAAVVPGESMTDASVLPVTTEVATSWTNKSALIVRDSMGGALSPYWQQAYSPTWQEWHEYGTFDVFPDYRGLVDTYSPDVVILQLAERHLIQAPPEGSGF